MIYSSSIVSKGRGSGIAIGTGLNTEIGSIAKSLQGDSGLIRKVDKSNGRQPQKENTSMLGWEAFMILWGTF